MIWHLVVALLALPMAAAYGEIPDWVKTSAGWWSEGAIQDAEFLKGVEFLIAEGVIEVGPADGAAAQPGGIPDWVRSSAGWWSQGATSDSEFVSAIEYLIGAGAIAVGPQEQAKGSSSGPQEKAPSETLQAELDACQEIKKVGKRSDCIDGVEKKIEYAWYVENSDIYEVGPVMFYYSGIGSEGNEFFYEGDQPIVTVRMLAENLSSENVALMCTGPAICSYDIWDGSSAFKFSATDFTNGQIVLRPGDSRTFNMLFGPNIGYGGTQFVYDPAKDYSFRISESWGSVQIPLDIK